MCVCACELLALPKDKSFATRKITAQDPNMSVSGTDSCGTSTERTHPAEDGERGSERGQNNVEGKIMG